MVCTCVPELGNISGLVPVGSCHVLPTQDTYGKSRRHSKRPTGYPWVESKGQRKQGSDLLFDFSWEGKMKRLMFNGVLYRIGGEKSMKINGQTGKQVHHC